MAGSLSALEASSSSTEDSGDFGALPGVKVGGIAEESSLLSKRELLGRDGIEKEHQRRRNSSGAGRWALNIPRFISLCKYTSLCVFKSGKRSRDSGVQKYLSGTRYRG